MASTLCKYNLRKGDLFVLSWARVRRVSRGSISSELLMCGRGARSILLLALVCFYLCCSDCVVVCGNVCCVAAIVKDSVLFSLGVLKYVCVKGLMDVFSLYCDAWSCRCSCKANKWLHTMINVCFTGNKIPRIGDNTRLSPYSSQEKTPRFRRTTDQPPSYAIWTNYTNE